MIDQLALWWLDAHYIASTLLSPGLAFIWSCWKGEAVRAVLAAVLCCVGQAARAAKR